MNALVFTEKASFARVRPGWAHISSAAKGRHDASLFLGPLCAVRPTIVLAYLLIHITVQPCQVSFKHFHSRARRVA